MSSINFSLQELADLAAVQLKVLDSSQSSIPGIDACATPGLSFSKSTSNGVDFPMENSPLNTSQDASAIDHHQINNNHAAAIDEDENSNDDWQLHPPKNAAKDIPPQLPNLQLDEIKEGSMRVWGHGTKTYNIAVPWKRAWAIQDKVNLFICYIDIFYKFLILIERSLNLYNLIPLIIYFNLLSALLGFRLLNLLFLLIFLILFLNILHSILIIFINLLFGIKSIRHINHNLLDAHSESGHFMHRVRFEYSLDSL
jgi:hypothetical protein